MSRKFFIFIFILSFMVGFFGRVFIKSYHKQIKRENYEKSIIFQKDSLQMEINKRILQDSFYIESCKNAAMLNRKYEN
jgi:hypothetical protein